MSFGKDKFFWWFAAKATLKDVSRQILPTNKFKKKNKKAPDELLQETTPG